ncbi:hypothetical protein Ancab_008833 [Ancistrocladus abbreviatus]
MITVIGKGNKNKKAKGARIEREATGVVVGQPSSRDFIKDSQIKNRNKIIIATSDAPDHSKPNLSPRAIWDFLLQLGVMEDMDEEEMIRCIEEMEAVDAAMYDGNRQKDNNDIEEVGNGLL